MSVTVKDVARLAGVSLATVSYVLNDGPRPVAKETRLRVLQAMRELGYQPNSVARSLKTRKTAAVGIVIPDILNPIHAFIAHTIEDELRLAGYNLFLCNAGEFPAHEAAYLRMLIGKQVDGIIISTTGANHDLLSSAVAAGRRVVLLDRAVEGLDADCVLFDNEGGAFAAVQHLIALGHRRVGIINLPPGLTPGGGRLGGYARALAEAGLGLDPSLTRSGSFTAEEAYSLTQDLLGLPHPPTALFVSSNRLCQGVLRYVREHRLRLPDDLAVCVFDDVDYYSYITPSLTAVAHDYRHLGREAARLLMERIERAEPAAPRTLTLPFQLHVRESTVGRTPETAENAQT